MTRALLVLALLVGCCGEPSKPREEILPPRQPVPGGDFTHYDYCLDKHTRAGLYNYAAHLADPDAKARWTKHLSALAEAQPQGWGEFARKAFWINAYNSLCIEGVLRRYPLESTRGVDGFFDQVRYEVGGARRTLNEIRQALWREFRDARLHFVLVSGDLGCLPLEGRAFTALDVDARLEEAAQRFARDGARFRVDLAGKRVRAAELLRRHAAEFTSDPRRPAAKPEQYLVRWLRDDEAALLRAGGYTLEIDPWDGRLNEWVAREP